MYCLLFELFVSHLILCLTQIHLFSLAWSEIFSKIVFWDELYKYRVGDSRSIVND